MNINHSFSIRVIQIFTHRDSLTLLTNFYIITIIIIIIIIRVLKMGYFRHRQIMSMQCKELIP
jgi:hypothetical protein